MKVNLNQFLIIFLIMLPGVYALNVDTTLSGSVGKQLFINNLVGDVIDAGEAKYYGLFSDIEGFESAAFYDFEYSDDSTWVRRSTDTCSGYVVVKIIRTEDHNPSGPDSSSSAAISIEKHVRISRDAFRSLQDYLFYFWEIVRDKRFREEFAENHRVEWPLITTEEMEASEKDTRNYLLKNSACCIGSLGAGGSYIGALAGTEMTYHSTDGCLGYYTYSVDPVSVYWAAIAGAGLGCMLSSGLYANDAKTEALRRGIVAFDSYNMPITKDDISNEAYYANRTAVNGWAECLGVSAALTTGLLLYLPWMGNILPAVHPETEADKYRVLVPIVAVSLAEFSVIMKISWDLGEKRDRQAAIERIKKKREQQREGRR
ncbi:MAG TPA: hypothetical protein VF399_04170 [bacterium]